MQRGIKLNLPINFRVTAGMVVYRKIDGGSEYLLIKSKLEDGAEQYALPKGGVDAGETLQETAEREVLEETGLILKVAKYLSDEDLPIENKDSYYWLKIFWFLADGATAKESESIEDYDVVWLSYPEALEKATFEDNKRMIELAEASLSS